MSLGPLNTGEDSWIDYAEKDVPQPQPPVALGFSNVKPDPIIFVVWSMVMPFRYCAENISTKSLMPCLSITKSPVFDSSSMFRLY